MRGHEFLHRSRQELSKRADAVLWRFGWDFSKASGLPANHSTVSPRRVAFFFQPDEVETLLGIIRQRLPEQVESTVARANKICSHRFDLLGYRDLEYGKHINWHLDAVHGKTAPLVPFHRVRYLDYEEVGDSKITWELNRHQHLVTLAKAYRATKEERFAQEIIRQWRSWQAQNPYPLGINWASSLEVAFRSLSWIWTHALLQGTKFLTLDFQRDYLCAQALNGRHIERYLSTYFSPNTHLLGEGVALFFLGTLCPKLSAAARWKSVGWQTVLQEAERQVNADGMHFEQSVYYHVYALDFFLHAIVLACANGTDIPAKLEHTVEAMMDALWLLGRCGPPPRFGDDDGGRVFDSARNCDEHLLDPLATGAILFGRGDFKSLCKGLREETIWLLGAQGVVEWDRPEAISAPLKSAALDSSGLYLLAAPEAGSQMVVKSGASRRQTRGHAHADFISVCLQSFGRELLIDPGTYEYVGPKGKRNQYRGTAMHNTLTVDGQDQAEPDGPFSWKQEVNAKTERWISGETFDLLKASHVGYLRLPQPVKHRRWVVALHSGIFLVRDLAEGEGEHRVELSWRLNPDLQLISEQLFRFRQSPHGLALVLPQDHDWSKQLERSPWSPIYGTECATTVMKLSKRARLPAEFVTLVVAVPEATSVPGKLTQLPAREADVVRAYSYQTKEASYQFFFAQSAQRWTCGAVASDAEFVCVTTSQSANAGIVMSDGSYVALHGNRVMEAARRIDRCEVIQRAGVEVFCSEPETLMKTPIENLENILGECN